MTSAQRGLEAGLTKTRKTMFADPVLQRRQVGGRRVQGGPCRECSAVVPTPPYHSADYSMEWFDGGGQCTLPVPPHSWTLSTHKATNTF